MSLHGAQHANKRTKLLSGICFCGHTVYQHLTQKRNSALRWFNQIPIHMQFRMGPIKHSDQVQLAAQHQRGNKEVSWFAQNVKAELISHLSKLIQTHYVNEVFPMLSQKLCSGVWARISKIAGCNKRNMLQNRGPF